MLWRQHAGKTVASLGIISSLKKVMDPARIGYFKPVGQEIEKLYREYFDMQKLLDTFNIKA